MTCFLLLPICVPPSGQRDCCHVDEALTQRGAPPRETPPRFAYVGDYAPPGSVRRSHKGFCRCRRVYFPYTFLIDGTGQTSTERQTAERGPLCPSGSAGSRAPRRASSREGGQGWHAPRTVPRARPGAGAREGGGGTST